MEPATIAMGLGILTKVMGVAMKAWDGSDDAFDKKDLDTLRTALETTGSLVGLRKGPKAPEAAALHLLLVTRCFGKALGRHQELHGMTAPLASAWGRWRSKEERARKREIELRMQLAAPKLTELGAGTQKELALLDALQSPLATPYYQGLWHAFTEEKLTLAEQGEAPPFDLTATAAREFERLFLLEYLRGLAAAPAIEESLEGLDRYRRVLVRDLLLRELSTWGGRHVFGNVRREAWQDGSLPFLALEGQYVEPLAQVVERAPEGRAAAPKKHAPRPIQDLLRELTAEGSTPRVLVVTADFGSGKSLSARWLAWKLAHEFLTSKQSAPELCYPVHVRCADDFSSHRVDLEETFRRASKRTADDSGYSVDQDDSAFAWHESQQRFLGLLDGLDEVELGREELRTLFQKLTGKTTAKHRFVVFTRPGVLPEPRDLDSRVIELRVLPFSEEQIDAWLSKWATATGTQLERAQLEERGLGQLAATPILLLMIAFTWAKHATAQGLVSRALLYEQFFQQLARGKAEGDREQHAPIRKASERLLEELQKRDLLDRAATATDAMLWFMGKVAWEALKLEQSKQRPLRRSDLEPLLEAELGDRIPEDALSLLELGLVLALQADLRSGNGTILFGHRSFREYLVARHWSTELLRIARGEEGDWGKHPWRLFGAHLFGAEDQSFPLLIERINDRASEGRGWTDADRQKLVRWAERTFNDESLQRLAGREVVAASSVRDDQRALLRHAALAIGSSVDGTPGIKAKDPLSLRTLLGWFWVTSAKLPVVAPQSNLQGANLQHADLQHANLFRANLQHANLVYASLFNASLFNASLTDANLRHADLINANLTNANLTNANLTNADLTNANLTNANLTNANLFNAILQRADLQHANLQHADLRGACLHGANLQDASLDGVILFTPPEHYDPVIAPPAARFDSTTRWPDGFSPPDIPPEQLDDPAPAEDFSGPSNDS